MIKKRTRKKPFNERDYKIIKELYYLNKEQNKVARLSINDARRVNVGRINKEVRISFRKRLSRIAAMW
jgi:hypothetical protein